MNVATHQPHKGRAAGTGHWHLAEQWVASEGYRCWRHGILVSWSNPRIMARLLALGGSRATRLNLRSSRSDLVLNVDGVIIARTVCTDSYGGLKPKVSQIKVHRQCAHLRILTALRFHVFQHTAWILPCALLSSVESTVQAKGNYPQRRQRY